MAVRFTTAATNRLSLTSSVIDYNSTYAWGGWIQPVVDTNANSQIFSISDATANNADIVLFGADGTTLAIRCVVATLVTEVTGTNVTVGADYYLLVVRESVTSIKLYIGTPTTALTLDITNTRDVTLRLAPTLMRIGASGSNSQRFDGHVSNWKAWTESKTLAEAQLEQFTTIPKSFSNLWGYWPMIATTPERARDYSGNGRNWTEDGTITDEDGPGISFGANVLRRRSIAAPVGGDGVFQPVMVRQQGTPTMSGYRDRPGKWN